jgi:hypothetical protein
VILVAGQDGALELVKAEGQFVIKVKGTKKDIVTPDFFKSCHGVGLVNYRFGRWDRLIARRNTFREETMKRPEDFTRRQGKTE